MVQIILPAQINPPTFRKDKSVSIKFDTRELTAEEVILILGFQNSEGWLQFSQNKEMKAPEQEAELEHKSPSQRLYNALYVLYRDKPRETTWQSYYNAQMENVIQMVLGKVTK